MAHKILIVEDDEMLSDVYRLKFEETNEFEIQIAKDGKQALDMMQQFSPDMVVLDLLMPTVDGYEVLETWYKEGLTKNTPILVATNVSDFASIQRAMKLGATDYFVKSEVMTEELIARCKEILDKKTNEAG